MDKPTKTSPTRAVAWVERSLGRLASWSHQYSGRVGLLVLLLCVGAAFAMTRLKVDADLIQLLPQSFASVQDVELLKERFGGVGYVVVVARHGKPEALERFARDITPKLEALPSVRHVLAHRPTDFFLDRALYYLDVDDLRLVEERIRARVEWERTRANPLFIDLEEEDPPSIGFADIQSRYQSRGDNTWISRQTDESFYLDRDKRMLALLVKPEGLSADLDFVRKVIADIEALIGRTQLDAYDADMRVDLTGRFKKRLDTQTLIEGDLVTTSWVALALVLLFITLHFRSGFGVLLIAAPLLTGLLWSYAFAALSFGILNILTAFIGAILIGLGIDHGIHLLGRYEAELSHGASSEQAVRKAFSETGRAVVIAALTTTAGFLGIALSEFRAFREFGVVAAVGMNLVVLAYTLCLPAMLGVLSRLNLGLRGNRTQRPLVVLPWIQTNARWVLAVALLVIIALTSWVPKGSFNYDFAALEATNALSYRLDTEVNQLLGYSQTPVAVLTDDWEGARGVAQAVRDRQEEMGSQTTIDFVGSTAEMIPQNQVAKQQVLQSIAALLDDIPARRLEPETRSLLKRARRMAKAEPFTRDDLPIDVRRQLGGDAPVGGVALVFPAISLSDGVRVGDFAVELRGARLENGEPVRAAGEAMVLADIIHMIEQESAPVLLITLTGVFLSLWLLCGRLKVALICLATGLGTLVALLGLLPMSGLRLNYLNIIMIPILFGIAIDGGVHLALRFEHQRLNDHFREVGRAIAGSILTTGLGFGALLLAHHNGLNGLGRVAVLGLAINAVACLLALPAWLDWRASSTRVQDIPSTAPQRLDKKGASL